MQVGSLNPQLQNASGEFGVPINPNGINGMGTSAPYFIIFPCSSQPKAGAPRNQKLNKSSWISEKTYFPPNQGTGPPLPSRRVALFRALLASARRCFGPLRPPLLSGLRALRIPASGAFRKKSVPAPSNRCFLVTTGAQKPPVKVSKQPVGGSW